MLKVQASKIFLVCVTTLEISRHNQVLTLMNLFNMGSWKHGLYLINVLRSRRVDPMDHAPIANALITLMEKKMERLYAPLSRSSRGLCVVKEEGEVVKNICSAENDENSPKDLEGFIEIVVPMLHLVRLHLWLQPLVFVKTCRNNSWTFSSFL